LSLPVMNRGSRQAGWFAAGGFQALEHLYRQVSGED
jgi:hypothetical protein